MSTEPFPLTGWHAAKRRSVRRSRSGIWRRSPRSAVNAFRGVSMRGYPQDRAEELLRGIQSSTFAPLLAGAPFVHITDLRLIVDYELTETALQHLFLDSGQRADHVV